MADIVKEIDIVEDGVIVGDCEPLDDTVTVAEGVPPGDGVASGVLAEDDEIEAPDDSDEVGVVDCVVAAVPLTVLAGVPDGEMPGASEFVGVVVCVSAAEAETVTAGVFDGVIRGANELVGVCVVVATAEGDSDTAADIDAETPTERDVVGVVVSVAGLEGVPVTAAVMEEVEEAVIEDVVDEDTPVVNDGVGVAEGQIMDRRITEPTGPESPVTRERALNPAPLAMTPKLAFTQLLPPPPPLWNERLPAAPPPPPNQPAPPPPPLATLI